MDPIRAGLAGGVGALVIMGAFSLFSEDAPKAVTTAAQPTVESQSAAAAVPEVKALRLDYGKELNAAQCDGVGSPVVNASQKIVNTVDSGEAGNYWAYDTFTRVIQVWPTAETDVYCAVVKYRGSFEGVEGQTSPGNTGVLTGRERGPMQGGYRASIEGTLLEEPLWNTNGGVGTTDYQCDIDGNCPGAINWVTQYFEPDYVFTYDWWGWIYRAGGKKFWVNSSEGNEGDII